MPCRTTKIPAPTAHGMAYAHAIVCSRPTTAHLRCVVCQRPSWQTTMTLCDALLTDGPRAGQACGIPMCRSHAVHTPPDHDLCTRHSQKALP